MGRWAQRHRDTASLEERRLNALDRGSDLGRAESRMHLEDDVALHPHEGSRGEASPPLWEGRPQAIHRQRSALSRVLGPALGQHSPVRGQCLRVLG